MQPWLDQSIRDVRIDRLSNLYRKKVFSIQKHIIQDWGSWLMMTRHGQINWIPAPWRSCAIPAKFQKDQPGSFVIP
jgi:hypothetical protein